jgi:hypothetical protein
VSKLFNAVGFQLCWAACVLGAGNAHEWIGAACVAVWSAIHLARTRAKLRGIAALACVGFFGSIVDTLQLALGLVTYSGWAPFGLLAPLWIAALWIAFATTFDSSLAWIAHRRWVCAALGAAGAPLSYLGGAQAGALELADPSWRSLGGIALIWSCAVPLSVALHRALQGAAARPRPE